MNLVNQLSICDAKRIFIYVLNQEVISNKAVKLKSMVEVYRTSVENQKQAEFLLKHLYKIFPDYKINFDLEDCDKILRVESRSNPIDIFQVIVALANFGFTAAVLEDSPKYLNEPSK